jgi:Nucleotidyl transferase AbiEii toxin, Type IV TA system
MLQKQALPTSTLNVLKKISPLGFLKDFNLVGGTALALYWGHRISDDIDLFTDKKIELLYIEGAEFISRTPIGLFYNIDSVKTDFLIYPYPFALKSYTEDSMQLAHLDDTVTMKLGAITNRGAKKDFVDLYYILQRYSFEKLCSLYTEKYKTKNLLALFRSLTYFDDAESKDMPELLIDKKLTWQTIKKEIEKKVKEYIA